MRMDMRDPHHRTEDQNQSWGRQLPRLVDAYLEFQYFGPPGDEGDDPREFEGAPWEIPSIDFYGALWPF